MKKTFAAAFFLVIFTLIHAEDFTFVVIGDSRPPVGTASFENFKRLIPRINQYNPAFIINLGDLIYGYGSPDKLDIWKDYTDIIGGIKYKYYQLPGNHDIFSQAGEKLYKKEFSELYYSFDFLNGHFVMLDSAEQAKWGAIGDKQLEWFKQDLSKNAGKSIYVFLHFPLWDSLRSRTDKKRLDFWSEKIFPVLKANNVKAVFGGHSHCYGPTREIEGIKFFITGGGGAELLRWYEEYGGKHHFMVVHVSDNTFTYKIVTEDGELTEEQADVQKNHIFAEKYSANAILNFESVKGRQKETFSVSLQNPYDKNLLGTAAWKYNGDEFAITPDKIAVDIPPGVKKDYSFDLKILKAEFNPSDYPRLEFQLEDRGIVFTKDMVFKKHFTVSALKRNITVDGKLPDWNGVEPIPLFDSDGARAADLYLGYTRDSFSIGVLVRDGSVAGKEENFLNDILILAFDRESRNLMHENNDMQLELMKSAGSVILFNRITGEAVDTVKNKITISVKQDSGGNTVYEIAFPAAFLKPLKLAPGSRFGFNFAVSGTDRNKNRKFHSLTPGIGYIGIDTSFESQVHFAELSLK